MNVSISNSNVRILILLFTGTLLLLLTATSSVADELDEVFMLHVLTELKAGDPAEDVPPTPRQCSSGKCYYDVYSTISGETVTGSLTCAGVSEPGCTCPDWTELFGGEAPKDVFILDIRGCIN